MKIMVCPLNGPRPILEFAYGGEVRPSPDPDTCTDAEWSAYVFNRSGSPGVKYEWWCHIASGFWFIALRDTARDLVLRTYPADSVRNGLPRDPAESVRTGLPRESADSVLNGLPFVLADRRRNGLGPDITGSESPLTGGWLPRDRAP